MGEDQCNSYSYSYHYSIRLACIKFGFFYVINHGVDKDMFRRLFDESRNFFSLPLEEKIALSKKGHRGCTTLYSAKLDPTRSKELLPQWRSTMETYYRTIWSTGRRLLSLVALALNLEDKFFENIGALDSRMAFLRLIHFPGEICDSNEDVLGASAHSDYGMITLLAVDGVPGLQVCRDKDRQQRVWEDVHLVDGALIVNLGDTTERLTNCLFRSTMHRVIPTGQERYSAAFFLPPAKDFLVERLKNCCSESNPPRFPPIRGGDYLRERSLQAYGSYDPIFLAT